MKLSDDNQVTIRDLSFHSDEEIKHLDEDINKLKVCSSRRGSLESKSPTRGSKCGRPANPVPRHKRDSHIKAEHKRRDKIQKGFDTLRELVPALENCSPKESKSSMLFKTAEHCRQLKVECKAQQDEALALHHEIELLGNQIHILQNQLPSVGVKVTDKSSPDIDVLFNNYIKEKSKDNWKFWMFSLLLKPLFEAYKKSVTGMTREAFIDAVGNWVADTLSLVNLRPAVATALRKVSTKTKIIDKPEVFEKDVLEQISLFGDENANHAMEGELHSKSNVKELSSQNITSATYLDKEATYRQAITPTFQDNQSHQSHNMPNISMLPNTGILSENVQLSNMIESMHKEIPDSLAFDTPMTSVDLWDIPVSLPTVDSFSSISDITFTTHEEQNLYDSMLTNSDSLNTMYSINNDQTIPHSFNGVTDISSDMFPLSTTNSPMCCNHSACSLVTTVTQSHQIQPQENLTFPSICDLDMVSTIMESSVDPVSFLLDPDYSKEQETFYKGDNRHSF